MGLSRRTQFKSQQNNLMGLPPEGSSLTTPGPDASWEPSPAGGPASARARGALEPTRPSDASEVFCMNSLRLKSVLQILLRSKGVMGSSTNPESDVDTKYSHYGTHTITQELPLCKPDVRSLLTPFASITFQVQSDKWLIFHKHSRFGPNHFFILFVFINIPGYTFIFAYLYYL
jgi:hypothetical protein